MPELSNFSLSVAILGDKFFLTEELKKNCLSKNIFVKENINQLEGQTKCIFLFGGFLTGRAQLKKKLLVETLNFARRTGTRVLIILPYVVNNRDRQNLQTIIDLYKQNKDIDCYLIFVGELFGNGTDNNYHSLVSDILDEYKKTGQIGVVGQDFKIYPVSVGGCIEKLLKICFTYGSRERVMVIAQNISLYGLLNFVKEVVPSVRFYEKGGKTRIVVAGNYPFEATKITKDEITETFLNRVVVVPKITLGKLKKKQVKSKTKWYLTFSFMIILILLSPFIFLFISAVSLKLSYNSLAVGRFGLGSAGFEVSNSTAKFAQMEMSKFSFLNTANEIAGILEGVSNIGIHLVRVTEDAQVIAKSVFGQSDYDIGGISKNISLDADWSYQELSILELNYPRFNKLFNSNLPKGLTLDTVRKYLLSARNISLTLPSLLGADARKTYLVLFQNNSELRPTGGFIGSFGLLTFEKGKMTDHSMFDVYTADGQLAGHVEPPAPLRKYLGEANWYLRDSNWDPDFTASASKAEWFLDKEIERSVDGVVGVDFEAVKSFLTNFGAIDVPGTGSINAGNLYQKIQDDVEEGFFPGSYKKTNLLVGLTDGVFNKLSQIKNSDYLNLAKIAMQNLNEKHVQLFSHDETISKSISELAWDGGVGVPTCGTNCQTIWFGTVEANLGVNKVNYYITRKSSFSAVYSKGIWQNTLEINLGNTASTSEKQVKQYKTYIRALADKTATFGSVSITDNGGTRNVNPDLVQVAGRVEAGVLAIISPQTTGKIIFRWSEPGNIDFIKSGGVGVFWRKQAGTLADPVSIKVSIPRFANSYPDYSLTRDGYFSYTTTLAGDLFPKISW